MSPAIQQHLGLQTSVLGAEGADVQLRARLGRVRKSMLERVFPRHVSQCLWQQLEVQRRLEGTKGQARCPEQLLPALHPCLVSDFWKLLRCFLYV